MACMTLGLYGNLGDPGLLPGREYA
jgi:hypothetical protein